MGIPRTQTENHAYPPHKVVCHGLPEGQKAYLANEYRKVLSEKRQSEAGKKAVTIREIKRGHIDEETVSSPISAERDRSRAEAASRFKVSEWKVRVAQEVERKAPDRGPRRG